MPGESKILETIKNKTFMKTSFFFFLLHVGWYVSGKYGDFNIWT